jgi:predicted amidohydrolase YtcJ
MVELIVTEADLVTMAPGAGPADSMLIRDGRIAAVGRPRRSARPRPAPTKYGSAGRPSSLA